jgi:STE24 endopeptidase
MEDFVNAYLIAIVIILIGSFLLELTSEILNVKHANPNLPEEFNGYYDVERYKKSQNYLKDNTVFGIMESAFSLGLVLVFVFGGIFNQIDLFARQFSQNPIVLGLVFSGSLFIVFKFVNIPFSAYQTFVLEARYGFNKTTFKTFVLDFLKGLLITAVIVGALLAFTLWFFGEFGAGAWVYVWLAITVFELFVMYLAPVFIMPLFNKFEPLDEGELKNAIFDYAKEQNFKLKGIFKMDGSRRSSKGNAFFTGFGNFRRIVLYDTLISKLSTEEMVSVLAHEVGHYKKRHIFKTIMLSVMNSGVMLFLFSMFIGNEGLTSAFGFENVSLYASLTAFSFIYTPISMLISIAINALSRKHEYEADAFSLKTYPKPEAFVNALKKLSVENLSNLTPHPFKVFLEYTHPPILKRIERIKKSA